MFNHITPQPPWTYCEVFGDMVLKIRTEVVCHLWSLEGRSGLNLRFGMVAKTSVFLCQPQLSSVGSIRGNLETSRTASSAYSLLTPTTVLTTGGYMRLFITSLCIPSGQTFHTVLVRLDKYSINEPSFHKDLAKITYSRESTSRTSFDNNKACVVQVNCFVYGNGSAISTQLFQYRPKFKLQTRATNKQT